MDVNLNASNVAEPAVRFLSAADVPPGYKLTEIGIIPEDWHILSLGEISSFRTGPFGSALHKSDYIEGGIPLINPMHIVDGEIRPSASTTVTVHAARRLNAYRFRRKDIVIGRRGDMGRCAVIGEVEVGWLCGTGSLIIRCNGNVDASFIQRTLTTERVIRAIEDASVGSTMVNLNQGALSRLQIQCPPIIEQRTIAEALSDVDVLLGALEALIEKKRAIKQGAMQQLLTGKTRLSGFSGDWETISLGELFEFKNGLNKPKRFFGHGTPIVNYMDVFKYSTLKPSMLEGRVKLTRQEIQNFDVRKGDVFFTRTSETTDEIGIATVMIEDASDTAFSGFVLRARPKRSRIYNGFKAYCFASKSVRDQIVATASYTTRALTNGKLLSQVSLSLPQEAEQIAISQTLSDMDTEIAALETRVKKTRAIKQGMMQQLLTGRIRLVEPQPAEAEA